MPSPPVPDQQRAAAPERERVTSSPAATVWSATPALLAFVLSIVFLWRSTEITGVERTYPVVLGVIVLVLGVVNLVRDLVIRRRESKPSDETRTAVGRTVLFIAVLLMTLILLEPAGFFPAMVIMVIGCLLAFNVRNPLVIAATTALIVGYAFLIFVRVLQVPFPAGFLGLT